MIAPQQTAIAIYYLIDPQTRRIRYVGYTLNPERRLRMHLYTRNKKHTHKNHWLRQLCEQRSIPTMRVVCWVDTFDEAKRLEVALIAALIRRGESLTNETAGGNGGPVITDVVRRKLSEASKRAWERKTPEQKAAHALQSSSRVVSADTRDKHSAARKKSWEDPVYREHHTNVMKGNTHNKYKKHPGRKVVYHKRMPPTPETREKMRQAMARFYTKKRGEL